MQDFARQEAQHNKVHMAFNQRLAAQGVKVDKIMRHSGDPIAASDTLYTQR